MCPSTLSQCHLSGTREAPNRPSPRPAGDACSLLGHPLRKRSPVHHHGARRVTYPHTPTAKAGGGLRRGWRPLGHHPELTLSEDSPTRVDAENSRWGRRQQLQKAASQRALSPQRLGSARPRSCVFFPGCLWARWCPSGEWRNPVPETAARNPAWTVGAGLQMSIWGGSGHWGQIMHLGWQPACLQGAPGTGPDSGGQTQVSGSAWRRRPCRECPQGEENHALSTRKPPWKGRGRGTRTRKGSEPWVCSWAGRRSAWKEGQLRASDKHSKSTANTAEPPGAPHHHHHHQRGPPGGS